MNKRIKLGIFLMAMAAVFMLAGKVTFEYYNIGLNDIQNKVSLSQMSNDDSSSAAVTQLVTENKAYYWVENAFNSIAVLFTFGGMIFVIWGIIPKFKNKEK